MSRLQKRHRAQSVERHEPQQEATRSRSLAREQHSPSPQHFPSPALQPVPPTPLLPTHHALVVAQNTPRAPPAPNLRPQRRPRNARAHSSSSVCTSIHLPEAVGHVGRPNLRSHWSSDTTSPSESFASSASEARRSFAGSIQAVVRHSSHPHRVAAHYADESAEIEDELERLAADADVEDSDESRQVSIILTQPTGTRAGSGSSIRHRLSPLFHPAPPIINASTQTPPLGLREFASFASTSSSAHAEPSQVEPSISPVGVSSSETESSALVAPDFGPLLSRSPYTASTSLQSGVAAPTSNPKQALHGAAGGVGRTITPDERRAREGSTREAADAEAEAQLEEWWRQNSAFAVKRSPMRAVLGDLLRRQSC